VARQYSVSQVQWREQVQRMRHPWGSYGDFCCCLNCLKKPQQMFQGQSCDRKACEVVKNISSLSVGQYLASRHIQSHFRCKSVGFMLSLNELPEA